MRAEIDELIRQYQAESAHPPPPADADVLDPSCYIYVDGRVARFTYAHTGGPCFRAHEIHLHESGPVKFLSPPAYQLEESPWHGSHNYNFDEEFCTDFTVFFRYFGEHPDHSLYEIRFFGVGWWFTRVNRKCWFGYLIIRPFGRNLANRSIPWCVAELYVTQKELIEVVEEAPERAGGPVVVEVVE